MVSSTGSVIRCVSTGSLICCFSTGSVKVCVSADSVIYWLFEWLWFHRFC